MTLNQIVLDYFQAFASRDLNQVMSFFSEEANLRDWEVSTKSLIELRSHNRHIFEGTTSIVVEPLNVVCNENIVMAEIDIHIDSAITLRVVDVLEFDCNKKIISIRAFKG
jgi:ketosteroid isomerase-like protein